MTETSADARQTDLGNAPVDGAEPKTGKSAPHEAPNCPWCRGAMGHWLDVPRDWRRPKVVESYTLFWCGQCEYGCVYPRPGLGELPSLYAIDSYYTHGLRSDSPQNDRMTFLDRVRCHLAWRFDRGRPISGALVHELLQGKPSRICDLGCGAGGLLDQARALGHSVVGVEPDPAALEVVRSRGVEVYEGTAENLPPQLEGASFDLVLMSHVLEHCLDPGRALRVAHSLLKPSGALLCETPNCGAYGLTQAGITWLWLDVPRHLNFFTETSIAAACTQAGFTVIEKQVTGYHRQFTPGWIESERQIWQVFRDCGWASSQLPARSSKWNSWKLLFRTALADRAHKYDSVRVLARKECGS